MHKSCVTPTDRERPPRSQPPRNQLPRSRPPPLKVVSSYGPSDFAYTRKRQGVVFDVDEDSPGSSKSTDHSDEHPNYILADTLNVVQAILELEIHRLADLYLLQSFFPSTPKAIESTEPHYLYIGSSVQDLLRHPKFGRSLHISDPERQWHMSRTGVNTFLTDLASRSRTARTMVAAVISTSGAPVVVFTAASQDVQHQGRTNALAIYFGETTQSDLNLAVFSDIPSTGEHLHVHLDEVVDTRLFSAVTLCSTRSLSPDIPRIPWSAPPEVQDIYQVWNANPFADDGEETRSPLAQAASAGIFQRLVNGPSPRTPVLIRPVIDSFSDNESWTPPPRTFECGICLDRYAEAVQVDLLPCSHKFCIDCLGAYARTALDSRRFPIVCPDCLVDPIKTITTRGTISLAMINMLGLPPEYEVAFYELSTYLTHVRLDCPSCRHTVSIQRDKRGTLSKSIGCPTRWCAQRWCKLCYRPVKGFLDFTHVCDGIPELEGVLKQNGWKRCPGCRTPTERFAGCDHMTCTTPGCNAHWSYTTGKKLYLGRRH